MSKFIIDKTGYNIKWDRDEDRIYETGTDMGVLYIKGENAPNDTSTEYGPAIPWNGLTSVNETSEGGEPNDVYADDIKYLSIPGNENAGFSLEAYTYPDEFGACDGSQEVNGVNVHQQRRKKFGFAFRSKIGDENDDQLAYKIHLYYNCLAAPSERSYQTVNDSPEAITFSWDVTTTPQDIGTVGEGANAISLRPSAHITIDTRNFEAGDAKLTALLKTLFGTAATEGVEGAAGTEAVAGKLPSIATVISMLSGT